MADRKLRHVIEAQQFGRDPGLLSAVLQLAASYQGGNTSRCMDGRILASLFYEASTRTRLSFEAAMLRLGGRVIGTESAGVFSSASKGESLQDTIRIICGNADVIVLRHPDTHSAEQAARVSSVPLINAGAGTGQHPTQALLDVYTIEKERGGLENLDIALVGDLKNGRTVHSLVYLLARTKGVRFIFISPEELRIGDNIKEYLAEHNAPWAETTDLNASRSCDVVYMTRVQKERFKDPGEYERLKGCYRIDRAFAESIRGIIMHPLPRVDEIAEEVDELPRAAYFRQAQNGLYVRMALLTMIFEQ